MHGSQSSVITKLDPPEKAQYAQGREAWQALVRKLNTKLQLDYQGSEWSSKLIDCVLTKQSSITMAKHVNDFNTYVTELTKLGRQDYSEDRLYTLFTDSILDDKYNSKISDGEEKGWTLDKLQLQLQSGTTQ